MQWVRQKCNFSKDSKKRLILFICHSILVAGFKTVVRLSSTCALKAGGEAPLHIKCLIKVILSDSKSIMSLWKWKCSVNLNPVV